MSDITVHRHGDRWAVVEAGAESPVKEFPTREAAELAAQQMAQGGAVNVVEDDPTGLADVQDHGAGEPELEDPKVTAGDPAERSRQPQTGL
jgi:Uncharacterized protein conserved in bacteria (DUF2188)